MIIIIHEDNKVISVQKQDSNNIELLESFAATKVSNTIFTLAKEYSEENIIWCAHVLSNDIDFFSVNSSLKNNLEMLSFSPQRNKIFDEVLEFVEFDSLLIHTNTSENRMQTWLMSESIGIMNAELINKFSALQGKFSFQMTLNAISKLGSPLGLLHYNEPSLYAGIIESSRDEDIDETLKFIASFYKRRWLFFIGIIFILKRSNNLYLVLKNLFTKKHKFGIDNFDDIRENMTKVSLTNEDNIDVLIPTLGRKEYLKDVLDDLSNQTKIPINVIIVEQHPDSTQESELDYITGQEWPFTIIHKYIHQLGACNARNIGLKQAKSKWLFMADDDIRLEKSTLADNIELMKSFAIESSIIGTYLPSQKNDIRTTTPYLFESFASGASIVERKYYSKLSYDMAYEFGYGEDRAYGNALRTLGCATVYSPLSSMLHLKAPVGGFRFKFKHPWTDDVIQPKPSPTIMYLYQNNMNSNQIFGYKVFLFASLVLKQKKINILRYKKEFLARWDRSIYYSKQYSKETK